MRTVNLSLDDELPLVDLQADVATGIAKMGGEYVRWVHVVAAREYTVPLDMSVSAGDALRLASAVADWDAGMMDRADSPFDAQAPKFAARQVIRSFLPKMFQCELRDLFVDTYGYAGALG